MVGGFFLGGTRGVAGALLAVILAAGACGGGGQIHDARPPEDGAPVTDAAPAIDSATPADAGVDAATARPGSDVSSAAGRMTGGGYTLDVQVGLPVDQRPASGGGHSFEGGAVIKP